MKFKALHFLSCILLSVPLFADEDTPQAVQSKMSEEVHHGEDMIITTGHKLFPNTTVATPSFNISKEDMDKTNVTGAEDAIRMAPSVHVRRRFYGDTNGVTAIRGSTNFQTGHFNMYVDGLPLHNPVQTKWNGGPKWNLIAPNAIAETTVFYGPYSAEHRGAFGGTFDLKTRLPEEFEMSMEVTGIVQQSHRNGQKEEVLTGHKEFISAGNRFGDWTFFGFYNHLENEGQAQSFAASTPSAGNGGTTVSGEYHTKTIIGEDRVITGDLGLNENLTDLYELKVSYDFNPDLRALFTIAFEDTERNSQARTYLKDANGNDFWEAGATVNNNGQTFTSNPSSFGNPALRGSENERKTLAYGFNLSGKLADDWGIDTTASFFNAFKDRTLQFKRSRNDPAYQADKSGRIRDIEVWWVDYSVKLATQNLFGRDDLGFMYGYQFNHSFLDINQYNSDYVSKGQKGNLRDADGGSTQTHSAFMQADWDFIENWNIMAGLRYDHWEALRGHINDLPGTNGKLSDRDASRVSPKASLSFTPTDALSFRYSFSKAYRFAVAEELFDSSSNTNSINISDPNLAPEAGYFHDFKIQYKLDQGYTSLSFFYNEIEDEIMRITTLETGGGTQNRTRGVDETETIGIEFVYQQDHIMGLPFALNMNGTWINKEIKKDTNNPDLAGKEWVRIPQWRANGTLTYHSMQNWDNIIAVQYRGKQHTNPDNSDYYGEVYGSSDEYVLVNFKSSIKMDVGNDMTAKFSVGVDNILDLNYYDHHPYPQRTYFATIGLDI
ncbi:MAG: TonB-dependent receptor [Methylococcales symbiont of Iophon sp. n. MRB-2018]|nr:MAG: TonB-dependent receptor [Methylococcales symbiont of Iophon sp. n. MRB-2018]KAF3980488.1 MAG: TonB-dependent receptor [Methylococcales symbiont of Iophon sp. n. MRB-2018]